MRLRGSGNHYGFRFGDDTETRPSRRGEVERELQRQLNRRLLTLPRNEG